MLTLRLAGSLEVNVMGLEARGPKHLPALMLAYYINPALLNVTERTQTC